MSEDFVVRALGANSELPAVLLKGQNGGKKITTMEDVAKKMAASSTKYYKSDVCRRHWQRWQHGRV